MSRPELEACLKPEHREAGYYLEEDEDFVYLKQGSKTRATWNAAQATAQRIQNEADRLIAEAKSREK